MPENATTTILAEATATHARFRTPSAADSRFKSWRKHITGVDCGKDDGYAFEGPWLKVGREYELPIGSLILCYDETGSVRNHKPDVDVQRLEADGSLTRVASASGYGWAADLRFKVRDLLATNLTPSKTEATAPSPELEAFTDADLIAEILQNRDGNLMAKANKRYRLVLVDTDQDK